MSRFLLRRGSLGASLIAVIAVAASRPVDAQTKPDSAWSIEKIHGPGVPFAVTLDEGTWMSLDLSPDGRTIVFDLLGDLYTMPVTGGTATRITQGPAFDQQPRFSPDGKRIVFVSDRSGSSNLWFVNPDGSNPKALTTDRAWGFTSPVFTPDGDYVITRRSSLNEQGSGITLFMYHVDGDGSGVELVKGESAPAGPSLSRDGRWLYFSTRQPFDRGGAIIKRFDRHTGRILPLTAGYGGAVRPAVSPDGKTLAFGRRIDAQQVLVLRDLETGAERVVYRGLDRDEQETTGSADLLPGYAFTPDGLQIIISARGKFRRITLATGAEQIIPFSARFEQTLTQRVTVSSRLDDGPVSLKLLRWHHASPDGRRIAFSAAGQNFLYDVASKQTRQLGSGPGHQFSPAISPDGRWVAWVDWRDSTGGHVYKAPIDGGAAVRLTTRAAHYVNPAWSADGKKLVVLQGSGGEFRGDRATESLYYEVRWLDATTAGPAHLVTAFPMRGIRRQVVRPKFDPTGTRIYFSESEGGSSLIPRSTDLVSVALDGTDRRIHLRFRFADDLIPSPDGKWVAFTEQHNVYVVPLPVAGATPIEVRLDSSVLPVRRLSQEGGAWVDWAADGNSVTWGWGPTFYRVPLERARQAKGPTAADTVHIALSAPRVFPSGQVVLRNARIITMGAAGIIERGDIVVDGGRIRAIGAAGSIAIPTGATVLDMSGKTIMPGMIDLHAHYYDEDTELLPERDWALAIQLAYGVTTIRDVSVRSQTIFTLGEMVETGRMIGPRIFSTGDIIWGWNAPFASPVANLEDARRQVRRLKALGATLIKQYMQQRRDQRQWVVQAAREEGLIVTPEGGGQTFFDLTMVMDGHSGLEHAIPTAPLYRDVISLFATAKTDYVPTLIVAYGGPTAETYFHQKYDVHDDAKLRRFTPHLFLDEKARRRALLPEEDYHFLEVAKAAAQILKAGGNIGLGAHGNRQGLGTHWELWGLALGGLAPLEALRTATTIPAAAMGLERDLGSLEAGKMADLVVLDANPIDDIRNTEKISHVMKAGVLRDGNTLDEVWPVRRPFGTFYWQGYGVPPR